ncbi:MAG: M3 family metallopeptidase [Bacteroidaceae bacterium]|nr:M3 family metallopeptidase [Bacteroidaceae bacterium]
MENPFFNKRYDTPHEVPPFDKIQFEHYEPAMMEGMRLESEAIEALCNNPEEPTFENTIMPKTGEMLENVTSVFFNLLSACNSPEMEELSQKMAPLLSEHSNRITMNERLFQRIKHVWEKRQELDTEQQILMEKIYDGFLRTGANLPKEKKEELSELRTKLSQLSLQFSQNELHDTNAWTMHLTSEDELIGLPESAVAAARQEAEARGLDGWVITLQAPSYGPFMQYSQRRDLREKVYRAMNSICTHENENNNFENVRQLVNLRQQLAQIMGHKTYADFVLERRMAKDVEHVTDLMDKLLEAYRPVAEKEVAEIEQLAKEKEGEDFVLQPWDFSHYGYLLKMQRYNIDSEMLRPYLQLEKVQDGVFGLATRLYGISFERATDIPVYHPDVVAYRVKDADGSFLAVLLADFHPRANKQSGAWMTTYREQWVEDKTGENVRPIVSIVMNFTKPTKERPALLTLGEVETFLHEFGHALHAIFSQVRYEALSCTNVYWDFVELPSQFMENYATEAEFLNTFARHYQTGEPMPEELIQRIRESRNFQCGYACCRQVSFCLLDMAYYTLSTPLTQDIRTFESEAWEKAMVLKTLDDSCMSVRFGHIMSGGYSAGYYSYKWAEVLDADAFSVFQQEGIFNTSTAARFRKEILSRGCSEHPMTLYKNFRGEEPGIDALLRRNGIVKTER